MKKHFTLYITYLLIIPLGIAKAGDESSNNSLSLQLNPSSFDDQLLAKDPFEKAQFVKSVQIRGTSRINSSYRTTRTANNRANAFSLTQISRLRMSGRITRTVDFAFNMTFRSNFLGMQENYGDAEDQREFGSVDVGIRGSTRGIGAGIIERLPIGLLSFGLDLGIVYYAGLLTYSGKRANLRNANFRGAPDLITPSYGFSTYERQFNNTGMTAQPVVAPTSSISPFRAKGFKLGLQDIGNSGISTFSFVGITTPNRTILRTQRNSITLFNRTSKLLNTNLFGRRASYELALNNQLITGTYDRGGNRPINYYIHSVTLGRRTNPMGRILNAEPFQPEYEIAFMRSVIPSGGPRSERFHTSVAKGFILKHALNGSVIGIPPLYLRLNMFHVDSGYVNPNGGFHNTTPISFLHRRNGRNVSRIISSDRMLSIDGVANNRQGINFQYGYDFHNIFGYDALRISAGHEVSRQITRSLRATIDNPNGTRITRTDLVGRGRRQRPLNKLYFSSYEADLKYLGKIGEKEFFFQTFVLAYTTRPGFHLNPDFSSRSLVRSLRVNTSYFYHIAKGVVPFLRYDYRRVRGNIDTRLFPIADSELSETYFSATDVTTKTITTGINFHFNRDYLVSLRYSHSHRKQLGANSNFRNLSTVGFSIIYNFRAS